MIELGLHLSSEDHGPSLLVDTAVAAEHAGLALVTISDHYHPWLGVQGSSPFVWSVIGGIAARSSTVRVISAVTCPTMRIHPAVIAQAAATCAVMLDGRFVLGVGTGENLNEHIFGDRWPPTVTRLAMLEEAIAVMRLLWQGGEQSHRGAHYTVEDAQVFNLPDAAPPVWVSAFGPKALDLACRVGDGYVGTAPEAELAGAFRTATGGKPAVGMAKCSWDRDAQAARTRIFRRWPNIGLPGQLAQELRTTALMEQACATVTKDMVAATPPVGPDPQAYADSARAYADAGYDQLVFHHIGDDQAGFARFLADEVRPLLT